MEDAAQTWERQEGGVPEWSGAFWEHDEFGYISVHVSDQRTHRPPDESWRFVRTYASEEDDAQVFLYRKVCKDCPCMHHLSFDNA